MMKALIETFSQGTLQVKFMCIQQQHDIIDFDEVFDEDAGDDIPSFFASLEIFATLTTAYNH